MLLLGAVSAGPSRLSSSSRSFFRASLSLTTFRDTGCSCCCCCLEAPAPDGVANRLPPVEKSLSASSSSSSPLPSSSTSSAAVAAVTAAAVPLSLGLSSGWAFGIDHSCDMLDAGFDVCCAPSPSAVLVAGAVVVVCGATSCRVASLASSAPTSPVEGTEMCPKEEDASEVSALRLASSSSSSWYEPAVNFFASPLNRRARAA